MKKYLVSLNQNTKMTGLTIFDIETEELVYATTIRQQQQNLEVRLAKLMNKIFDTIDYEVGLKNIKYFAFEAIPYGNKPDYTKPITGLFYLLTTYCLNKHIPYSYPSKTTIKRYATGDSSATINDMLNALPEDIEQKLIETGYKKSTGLFNMAEAYFVGKLFLENIKYFEENGIEKYNPIHGVREDSTFNII